MPWVSLVVPAFNEEAMLPRLLDSIDEARVRYSRGADAVEVIVSDNGSTDNTALVAASRGCTVVRVERKSIAAARNGGARRARGRLLAFVDADFRIHPLTFDAIEASLGTGRFVGGATGLTMERWSAGIAVTYALLVAVVWATGLDAGIVFCARKDFESLGGYDEERLYAEDVKFLLALRRLGRSRGQPLTRLRAVKALASARKFDTHGEWHALNLAFRLILAELKLSDQSAFVERYWYDRRPEKPSRRSAR